MTVFYTNKNVGSHNSPIPANIYSMAGFQSHDAFSALVVNPK